MLACPLPSRFEWTAGQTFAGRFELLRPAGSVRHQVWRVRAEGAVSVIKAAVTPSDRLRAEGDLLEALPRGPLPTLLDRGTDHGHDWLCLEDRGPGTLQDELQLDRHWTFDELLDLLGALATALAQLRAHGIVHGDVGPANVVVGFGTGTGRFCLVDLETGRRGVFGPTTVDCVMGTPHFVAPEVLVERRLHPTSDVWSAARLVATVAAGRLVHTWPQERRAQAALCRLDPDDPRQRALVALLGRCLEIDADRRPRAEELVIDVPGIRRASGRRWRSAVAAEEAGGGSG